MQHVTSQGTRRQTIFRDDADRDFFLRELARTVVEHCWLCLGYCLMGNHYHLVVETPEPNLGDGMRDLLAPFVRAANERHGLNGRMFKAPFHSKMVTTEEHFVCLLRYVALNPVKDGFCSNELEWPWSSHLALMQGVEAPLSAAGRVEARLEHWGGAVGTRYRALFAPGNPFARWADGSSPLLPRPSLEELLTSGVVDESMRAARWDHGYRLSEIASHVGLSEATISRRTRKS